MTAAAMAPTRARHLAIAVVLVLLAARGHADAQPAGPPTLTLTPSQVAPPRAVAVIDATAGVTSDPPVSGLASRLESQLDREPRLVPVRSDRRPALVGGVPDETGGAIAEARSALARARDAMARFDRKDAIAEADRGLTRAVEVAPGPELAVLMADLAMVRGLAHLGQGDRAEASAHFALVHRLDAGRTLDPVKYRPEVRASFDQAATETEMTTIDVAAPAGAEVWIDARRVGPAPATTRLPAGLHVVTVTGERLVTRGQLVDARGDGSTITIEAAEATGTVIVRRLRQRLASASNDADRIAAVAALVRAVGGQDAIVVGRDHTGALITMIYSGRTGSLTAPQAAEGVDVVDIIAPLRPLEVRRDDRADRTPEVPLEEDPPWFRRRWVQWSIGSGVAVVLVSSLVYALTRPIGESMVTGPDWAEPE